MQALAARYDNFWASVGVHPDNEDIAEPSVEDLVQRSALPKVVAIGETGLDNYRKRMLRESAESSDRV